MGLVVIVLALALGYVLLQRVSPRGEAPTVFIPIEKPTSVVQPQPITSFQQQAITEEPKPKNEAMKKAEYYHNQGKVFETKSQWAAAASAYRKALSAINNYPYSMLGLANMYSNQQKYDMAIQEYLAIIKTNPSFEFMDQVHSNLGVVYIRQKKYDLAIEECQYAIALNPRFARSFNIFGNAYEFQGDYQKALEQYRQAQAIGGDQLTAGNIDRILKLMNKSGN